MASLKYNEALKTALRQLTGGAEAVMEEDASLVQVSAPSRTVWHWKEKTRETLDEELRAYADFLKALPDARLAQEAKSWAHSTMNLDLFDLYRQRVPSAELVNHGFDSEIDLWKEIIVDRFDLDVPIFDEMSLVSIVMEINRLEKIRELCGAGAGVSRTLQEDPHRYPSLLMPALIKSYYLGASAIEITETLEAIVKAGAGLEEPDDQGQTLLHLAAKRSYPEVVRWCLEKGMNPNALTDHLKNPLHMAVAAGESGNIEMLMRAGADPHQKCREIKVPMSQPFKDVSALELAQALGERNRQLARHSPNQMVDEISKCLALLERDLLAREIEGAGVLSSGQGSDVGEISDLPKDKKDTKRSFRAL